jgi:hypothetical protein
VLTSNRTGLLEIRRREPSASHVASAMLVMLRTAAPSLFVCADAPSCGTPRGSSTARSAAATRRKEGETRKT